MKSSRQGYQHAILFPPWMIQDPSSISYEILHSHFMSILYPHNMLTWLPQGEFWVDPFASISKAYEMTDKSIISHGSDLGNGGSTAVTAILLNGQTLWVANVGDSRAVLSRGGKAIQMSRDHEPSVDRCSIEDKGGFVSNLPGCCSKLSHNYIWLWILIFLL